MKKLWLNKEIYSRQSISEAVKAYSGYAGITVLEEGAYLLLLFSDCKYDETRTIKEFENYLIDMENT